MAVNGRTVVVNGKVVSVNDSVAYGVTVLLGWYVGYGTGVRGVMLGTHIISPTRSKSLV